MQSGRRQLSSALWDNLLSSKDVQEEISSFNSRGYYRANGGKRKGLTNVKHAYMLQEAAGKFDSEFFSIPPTEAIAMDPQQRLLLENVYEALENAGISLDAIRGTDTAVYTGIFGSDYHVSLLRDLDATAKYQSTGTSIAIAANRISYFFDLHGPSMAIDTACSSTIVALHQAIATLTAGEAEMAVVCGANLIIDSGMFIHMSELGFLSPTGRCRSFDADGDGYARAEGLLSLIPKPLGKAITDNDNVRAVIRGTRINQDGRTQGITLPSSEAQRLNMKALYQRHHIDPADIQYLEAHGAGTAAGDPLELAAIDAIFGSSHANENLVVGSIKSNIGHLEACAALAGIVKTVECLGRGQIPSQMHFQHANPKIDWSNVKIPTGVMEWPHTKNGRRMAAVNSFGFGGTNGHAVLENWPKKTKLQTVSNCPFLFKVSATNKESIDLMAEDLANYVETRDPDLLSLAHTTLSRRSTLKKSRFIVASSSIELVGFVTSLD
ncbi:hypothetical protein GJ744_010181 [Endocarpon pusillum]|uniref:Ketosynthase family 3 (KS3) domain-containing protein n=1 Tax=Endocarpon pusillum TaxID=364733 RepID=A0A8H7AH43_9EURO|nr:hypothetical protein GJ744_010181 [Endocarpon pusillum]